MSRITDIRVTSGGAAAFAGLKGQQFHVKLQGVDLFVGPNGSGKTTRGPLAIAAALEGLATTPTDPRRPYVGQLPKDTVVELDVDTGGTLSRLLDARAGTKIALAADQLARDLIGIPPTAWDLGDFASGTDGDRAKIIDAVARAGGQLERWDAHRAQVHARGLIDKKTPPEIAGEKWAAPLTACIVALASAPTAAAWLKAAITWATNHQKEANRAQKEADGHLGTLNDEVPSTPGITIEAAQAAYGEAVAAVTALDTTAHQRVAVGAARDRHAAEGHRLAAQLEATVEEGHRLKTEEPEPVAPNTGTATRRITAAKAELAEPVEAPPGGTENCLHCGEADPLGTDARQADANAANVKRLREQAVKNAEGVLAAMDKQTIAAHDAWEARESKRLESLTEARGRWGQANTAHEAWSQTSPPELPEEPDQAAREAAAETVAIADRVLSEQRQYRDHLKSVGRASEDYSARRVYWDASRCLVAALRQTRDDVASAAYKPIDTAVKALLTNGGERIYGETPNSEGLPIPYFNAPDDYGADIDKKGRIPFAALSESETRITAAAIVYALATVAGCACRLVLVDGLEVVQRDHRAPLLAALVKARGDGLVDTVVLTMATSPDEDLGYVDAVEGLTVHHVQATTATAGATKPPEGGQVSAPF